MPTKSHLNSVRPAYPYDQQSSLGTSKAKSPTGCHHKSLLKKPLPVLKETAAVRQVIFSSSFVRASAVAVYLPYQSSQHLCHGNKKRVKAGVPRTGGISLGKSTLLVISILPGSMGHSRSILPTSAHRSTFWWMSVMTPYLTVIQT